MEAGRGRGRSVRGVAERRVAGYEYSYTFSTDDDIASLYKYKLNSKEKTYLFEIRTNFSIKKINAEDEFMDSERFDAQVYGNQGIELMIKLEYRLAEYWMTNDEIDELVRKAFDFAVETSEQDSSRLLIPIVVHLDVCTVQQENEMLDSVNNRAITAEKLVPFYIWPVATGVDRQQFDNNLLLHLLDLVLARARVGEDVDRRTGFRPRIRVDDVEEGMTIMPLCDICLSGPTIGTHISVLPCNHGYHSHCIVKKMLAQQNYLCPTCHVPAHPYIHLPPAQNNR